MHPRWNTGEAPTSPRGSHAPDHHHALGPVVEHHEAHARPLGVVELHHLGPAHLAPAHLAPPPSLEVSLGAVVVAATTSPLARGSTPSAGA